jgi:hypothetical protein
MSGSAFSESEFLNLKETMCIDYLVALASRNILAVSTMAWTSQVRVSYELLDDGAGAR